ncbi:MAG: hypothetical protein ABIJ12_09340 [bacterium]
MKNKLGSRLLAVGLLFSLFIDNNIVFFVYLQIKKAEPINGKWFCPTSLVG